MGLFITTLFSDPIYFFMIALVVCFSVSLHEYFHAQVALWEGDPTAADAGHLTLNPLKQMGVVSLIMFCVIGLCWGAVSVDPRNFRSRWSDLRISLAGPFANLLILAVAWLGYGYLVANWKGGSALVDMLNAQGATSGSIQILRIFGIYNFVLLVINLLPLPGLDGWAVLRTLLPNHMKIRMERSELAKGFLIFSIFLAVLFIGYFWKAALWFMSLAPNIF